MALEVPGACLREPSIVWLKRLMKMLVMLSKKVPREDRSWIVLLTMKGTRL